MSNIGRFNGTYVVREAAHTLSDSGYQTSFQVGGAESLVGLGELDGERGRRVIGGVAAAVVVDNRDKQGMGRIQVRLPGWSDNKVTYWARVAAFMAGAERGALFLPEIDDEVLVGFEFGDVTRPYVLGALWNGKDKPPISTAEGNNDLRLIEVA